MISLWRLLNWPGGEPEAPEDNRPVVVNAGARPHIADGPNDLSDSLVQALRMLLEGLPLEASDAEPPDGASKRAALLRRLEGATLPFDVLELASDALTAVEESGIARQKRGELDRRALHAGDNQAELARAALQGIKTLIEGLRVGSGEAGGSDAVVDELLGRLDGPVVPFDILEIAGDAVSIFEQDSTTRKEQRKREEEQHSAAHQQAQLAKASLQALQMLLRALPAQTSPGGPDTRATRVIPELLHRIEGPLSPPDVLAIANEALIALEQDAKAAGDRQRSEEEGRSLAAEQMEMAGAFRQAFQMLLGELPLPSATAGIPELGNRRAVAELLRRVEGPLSPAGVLETARETLAMLRRDGEAAANHFGEQEQQREWAGRQVALSAALLESLQSLLSEWPLTLDETGQPDAGSSGVIAGLLLRLDGPLDPATVIAVSQDARIALKQDAETGRDRERRREDGQQSAEKHDDLAKTLLHALQILLGNWPGAGGGASEERKRSVDDLLRRLQEPLLPFDILEIATDALTAFEQDAKAAAESQQKNWRETAEKQAGLLSAYLQALRMLLAGLPARAEASGEFNARGERLMAGLLRRLEDPPTPSEVADIATEALTTLQEDNKAVQSRFQLETRERQGMIAMLADAVAALSATKTGSITWLRQIEQRIDGASTLDDLRTSTSALASCLQTVRQTLRQALPAARPGPAEGVPAPERRASGSTGPLAAGLKARGEGPELAEGVAEPKEAADYAVVFVLDREFAIANRFGENVRHSALRAVQQHLKNGLMPSDRLVRWKGAAFLASLKRVGSVPDVRAELASLGSISAPQVISVDNRSIRLPISLSWAVFPQAQFASLDLLFERVDEFIARAQVPRAK